MFGKDCFHLFVIVMASMGDFLLLFLFMAFAYFMCGCLSIFDLCQTRLK